MSRSFLEPGEIMSDNFAGGGGASKGMEEGAGAQVEIAINHDPEAIAMHEANHPHTEHFPKNVWKIKPRVVVRGRRVGVAWFSPDCKHFSRAKGSKPVDKKIRGLAWSAVRWVMETQTRIFILENVREFEDWGPLVPQWRCENPTPEMDYHPDAAPCWIGTEGQARLLRHGRRACPRCDSTRLVMIKDRMVPDPKRLGLTFRRFVGRLKALGYHVEYREMDTADYGAPTHRRRLYLVGRNDGAPIVWPEPTHGDPKLIGGDLFSNHLKPWRTADECIDWSIKCPSIFERKRPLKSKTMERIAKGMKRYVLESADPFIIHLTHCGDRSVHPITETGPTVTGAHRGELGLISPVIVRIGQTGRKGKFSTRANAPLTTITSKAEHLLVAPVLSRQFGKSVGSDIRDPAPCVMPGGGGKTQLVAAFLAKHFGGVVGVPVNTPLPTTTARGTQTQIVAANLVHLDPGGKQWSKIAEPMRTVRAGGNHAALVYSFMVKYFGTAIGQSVKEPCHTVTSKDRFGLVTVQVNGETYVIVDIGMRMLTPRELARCQGFPDSYILDPFVWKKNRKGKMVHKRLTKTAQVRMIGNSVSPVMAKALTRAQLLSRPVVRRAAA